MTAPSLLLISNGFQSNYEKAFANGLAKSGCPSTLIASNRTLTSELHPKVSVINLRGSQDPKRSRWQKAINLIRYVTQLATHIRAERYAVVHLTGMFMTANVTAGIMEWILYRALCNRFVMTVHNILPHGRHGLWHRINYHIIYRLPHLLVVHTKKMRDELIEQFGIDAEKIVVMAHGVDEVPLKLTLPTPHEKLRALLFGGLSHYKGVDQFLRAAKTCPDTPMEIIIAGESRDGAYAALIAQLISEQPKEHAVQWHRNFIEEDEVKNFFEWADVVVLPYRHIDQSGVLFTAFRFGVPLIASDVGSFKETLPEFAGIIAPSSDPAHLAESVRAFASNRQTFDRMRIREHAEKLSWPNAVQPLINAYQRICA